MDEASELPMVQGSGEASTKKVERRPNTGLKARKKEALGDVDNQSRYDLRGEQAKTLK